MDYLTKRCPRTPIIDSRDLQAVLDAIFDGRRQPVGSDLLWLRPLVPAAQQPVHGDVSSFCLIHDQALSWTKMFEFLRWLALHHARQLLRMKGVLNLKESELPVIVQGVEHYLFPEKSLEQWPSEERLTTIVVIGDGLDEAGIRARFAEAVQA
ncbi:GTP-binding protein [Pseudomonas savastanoi]|uniref:GTP-binding protein n=1 Tax=Pseudomonas savastanoi TaxID=29438 RepID=UPI0016051F73|nr:GTP-binding protein [Pseudomonas savastanoi]